MNAIWNGRLGLTLLAFFYCCSVAHGANAALAAPLQAGVAVMDITPPVGYRMCGYFYERLSTGTQDPLQAKAICLRQGDTQAALVFCDLIGLPQPLTERVRAAAARKTGIPAAHILIAATHSHTGPLFFDALRTHLHQRAVAQQGEDPNERIDYPAVLADRLVAVIAQAKRACQPVELAAGVTRQAGLSFNRRFHMKDGTVVFNPGKLNPNIVRVAGPIDPEVGLLRLRAPGHRHPLALLTVFALHLDTTSGTLYSADFPYYLERGLRQEGGENLISLFGNGTCGDINHLDFSSDRPQKGGEETVRIGTALAKTVGEAWPRLPTISKPALAIRRAVVRAPLQQFSADQIARARQRMPMVGTAKLAFLEQVEAYKVLDVQEMQERFGPALPLEVQVFRLDQDTAIVGLPGEVFVEIGLAIKRDSPFKHTFVIELCNDDVGYVPTRKAFAEGSYETVNSRVQPGGGELLVETALKLLKAL